MRDEVFEQLKSQIINNLSAHLKNEGISFYIASNDNMPPTGLSVILEKISTTPLGCNKPLAEIRVLLDVLGKKWQCAALIEEIYYCLQPHQLTLPQISVLLMSMHVESSTPSGIRRLQKTTLRYIIEEEYCSERPCALQEATA